MKDNVVGAMASERDLPLYCSFCGKSQHDVVVLIAGPTVFICDECTDLCASLAATHRVRKAIREEIEDEVNARVLKKIALLVRDTDGSPKGPDPKGLDGEAATAGAAESGIAHD